MGLTGTAGVRGSKSASRLRVAVFGLQFPGPVGLGAGYERTGEGLPELERQGFGFIELGTVTPEPVAGHNPGVDALCAAVARHRERRSRADDVPLIGINLGRQPDHPLCDAGRDFEIGMHSAWACADYLAINLTGPAAQALLAPDRRRELVATLEHVREQQERNNVATAKRVPVLLKYPIVAGTALDHIVPLRFDGLIAVFGDAPDGSPGPAQRQDVARLAESLGSATALIAGSGIKTASDAARCLDAGARLVQIHRAYVEHGGALIACINRQLTADLARAARSVEA